MSLADALTTPHMGGGTVAMCEQARPQSAEALRQDQRIRSSGPQCYRGYAQAPCVVHACVIPAPLSFLSSPVCLQQPLWSVYIARSSACCWGSGKTDGHHLERWHTGRGAERPDHEGRRWLHRQRAAQVDLEAVSYLMHEVWMDNEIRREDEFGSWVPARGENNVGEHRIKGQDHTNPKRKPFSEQLHVDSGHRKSHARAQPLSPHSFPTKGLFPGKGTHSGAHEVDVHCLKKEGSKGGSHGGPNVVQPHFLPSCLVPWWQVGKVWDEHLMWGTNKIWRSLQNGNTFKHYRTDPVIVWLINGVTEFVCI